MGPLEFLLFPPVAFVIFLGVSFAIYGLGKKMAPKLKRVGGKLATYACGENFEGEKIQFGYRKFFFIALFFTIMHVAALVVATAPAGRLALLDVVYLVVIFLAVMALPTRS